MGLDMYLNGKKWFSNLENVEDGYVVKEHILELGYWRKYPDLHGYIVQTFANGVDECQPINLTEEQLEQLIDAIAENKLIPTTGFFFGTSHPDYAEDDIKILKKALDWLKKSVKHEYRSVVYQASW